MTTGIGPALLLLFGALGSPLSLPPQPVCTSCADWCSGACSFGGPDVAGLPNTRQLQNITIYRMTAANVTDLDSKNTGDPAGDLVFNMDERAIPLVCRHSSTASTNPDCIEGNTHSWLLNSNLVYLQWEIEVDGVWGPYQMCNMNLTDKATGKQGDGKWSCVGGIFSANFTDRQLCGTCARTGKAVGWKFMNATTSAAKPAPVPPSASCNATFQRVCAGETASYTNCSRCYTKQRRTYLNDACGTNRSYEPQLCPRPPKPSAACNASTKQLCGQFANYTSAALRHNCIRCISNHSKILASGACGDEGAVVSLMGKDGFCPLPFSWWNSKSNSTWIGPQHLRMNHRKMAALMGGSWFSTTAEGRCDTAKGQRPGDGSGCSWRPIGLKKAVNYSCVQSNVAKAVLAHGKSCFAHCPDGTDSNPHNPSDCWLRCFFNSFLGNVSLGLAEMTNRPLLENWKRSFDSDDVSAGGCAPAAITPPLAQQSTQSQ